MRWEDGGERGRVGSGELSKVEEVGGIWRRGKQV